MTPDYLYAFGSGESDGWPMRFLNWGDIGTLAIDPHLVRRIGLGAAPVRAEAVLLIILVFAGVNVGWLLLFEEAPDPAFTGRGGQARQASLQHARD